MREAPQRISPLLGRYLDFGTRASAQQLLRADRRAEQGAFALERCFDAVVRLLLPSILQSGFAFYGIPTENHGSYVITANFSETKAISVPMGLSMSGLQIVSKYLAPADVGVGDTGMGERVE